MQNEKPVFYLFCLKRLQTFGWHTCTMSLPIVSLFIIFTMCKYHVCCFHCCLCNPSILLLLFMSLSENLSYQSEEEQDHSKNGGDAKSSPFPVSHGYSSRGMVSGSDTNDNHVGSTVNVSCRNDDNFLWHNSSHGMIDGTQSVKRGHAWCTPKFSPPFLINLLGGEILYPIPGNPHIIGISNVTKMFCVYSVA